MASQACYITGVGLTPFIKPSNDVDYPELALSAGTKALLDAQLNYDAVEAGIACYCYGDSTCGQRAFYQFGMTGIPILNVNNNCSTGSTGLYLGRNMITSGQADVVMVLGFEKMSPGALKSGWDDRASPIGLIARKMVEQRGWGEGPMTAQMFGNAGREYMEKYGADERDFAEIARVNHMHSVQNPYAQFRKEYTLQEVMESPMLHSPITKLQACPTSSGAAAAILVSKRWLDQHGEMKEKAVQIAGQALTTDSPSTYEGSAMSLVGYDMTKLAAKRAMTEAGIKPDDVGVCELHDCFSANELVTLPALGLCDEDKAHEMVRNGDITHGGRIVVNPSGGLISKGHPLGATGIAQAAEIVWQLRGWANNRLVKGTKAGLQHILGLGGACVVGVYRRADGEANGVAEDTVIARASGLGHNPATSSCKPTSEQVDQVRSRKARSEYALKDAREKRHAKL